MSIYEYDQDEHIRLEREDAFEDGRKIGREEGREEGIELGSYRILKGQVEKKLEKGCSVSEIAEMLEEEPTVIEKLVAELKKQCVG